MELHGIRHLPVVEDGSLVGVITERDARLTQVIESATGNGPPVGEICSIEPYVVFDDTEVAEVTRHMAQFKIDCALIADRDAGFVGIFTTVDACKLIYMILEEEAPAS